MRGSGLIRTVIRPPAIAVRGQTEKRIRRTFGQLGIWRVALTVVLVAFALILARYSWYTPMLVDAERALYDVRAGLRAPLVAQDKRITMVTFTDEVLIKTKVRSPLDRGLLAAALARLDSMHPKSIGIDILFDQDTDADDALRQQLRAMHTPTYVAFAEPATNTNNIQMQQYQFLTHFLASVETAKTRPASIRLENDLDDINRRWPGRAPGSPSLLTVAMANQGTDFDRYTGGVRWRLPLRVAVNGGVDAEEVFEKIPIDTFVNPDLMSPEAIGYIAESITGRHILIGGDIIDTDQFTTPLQRLPDFGSSEPKPMIGLEVHANMLAQILDHAKLRPISPAVMWLAAVIAVLAGLLTAALDLKPWLSAVLLVLQMVVIAIVPFMLQGMGVDTLDLPVAGWGGGWLIAFIAAAAAVRAVGAEERNFAQSALGKYLPRDIAQEILRDPDRLALHGEKREIYCLFSDLEGFTKMSHAISPENVALVLNAYLDTLSEVVLAHGGTIDKFVGDAVVAFWGAPISRADDADQAANAMIAMAQAGEAFRVRMAQESNGELPPIGRTRVGVHFGEAVVGNFGGEGRIQYTALGDSMNTAARLEGANKPMKTRALISREAKERTSLDIWVPMGRIELRGRAQPVEVFEPRPDLSPDQRAQIAALVAAHDAGKGPEFDRIAGALRALAEQEADVAGLITRLQATPAGGHFSLS